MTVVWGATFVQVKDALALYPLSALLAWRFAIAALALAPIGLSRVRTLGRHGLAAAIGGGVLIAGGFVL